MKSIPKSILVSLFPLLAPLNVFAEPEVRSGQDGSIQGIKGNATPWRASELIGHNVTTSTDETIGEINDLVVDMKAGEIVAVIISSGGFLGAADTLSAVPVTALRYDAEAKAFRTGLTKKQLGGAPQFKNDAWPDYSDATSIDALRSFRDSIGGDVTAPDNTAQNEKEIHNDAANPTDQGNSTKDIQITKDIRSNIMDTDLSFNAKNIKIITRNEHVSLKGVVESDSEHQEILKIAGNHADTSKITDHLKVNSK